MANWLLKLKYFMQEIGSSLATKAVHLSDREHRQMLYRYLARFDYGLHWKNLISVVIRLIGRIKQIHPVLQNNAVLLIALSLFILILFQLFNSRYSLSDLKESGELVVISHESPTTWYQGDEGPAGPEYDYLASFAEFLGVKLRFDIRDSSQAVLEDIAGGEGHLAAAGMTRHSSLEQRGFVFGPEYQ